MYKGYNSKEDFVNAVKKLIEDGVTKSEIARKYNVTRQRIHQIVGKVKKQHKESKISSKKIYHEYIRNILKEHGIETEVIKRGNNYLLRTPNDRYIKCIRRKSKTNKTYYVQCCKSDIVLVETFDNNMNREFYVYKDLYKTHAKHTCLYFSQNSSGIELLKKYIAG